MHLDTLLEQYLTLLDTYTSLREELSKQFSSGFFNLASAQRNASSTLGAGRRYGEEGYDGRMKALRRMQVRATRDACNIESVSDRGNVTGSQEAIVKEEPERSTAECSKRLSSGSDYLTNGIEGTEDEKEVLSLEYTIRSLPYSVKPKRPSDSSPITEPLSSMPSTDRVPSEVRKSESSPPETSQSDRLLSPQIPSDIGFTDPGFNNPLRWYGVLIPQNLRQSQSDFLSSVTGTIPRLLSTTSAMQKAEGEIWDLRKQLGMLGEYNFDAPAPGDGATKTEADAVEPQPDKSVIESTQPKTSGAGLVSRSPRQSARRSHLLKLGQ